MTKVGWAGILCFALILLGFILWLYNLERAQEQDKKRHCGANSGVYFRPYKSRGICLQLLDGKLKEL